jgi:hypothetical protein
MGYKKIQEKRKELSAKMEARSAFMDAAQSLNTVLGNVDKTKQQAMQKMGTLKTDGMAELEAYKSALLAYLGKLDAAKPPSLDAVVKLVDAADKDLKAMIGAWEDKLAASCPKDVKPGMTFKDTPTQRIFEIKSGPEKAANGNLAGDQAVWFKGDWFKDGAKTGSTSLSLADLKKYKYLHTV